MEREKRTISVRLNGKEQDAFLVKDEIVAVREEGADNVEEEFIPKPDNVIDFGELQEERKKKGQPFWDDGNRENGPKLPLKRKKKPRETNGKRSFPIMMFVVILSAIIVGISFGFMVLTVFTGSSNEQTEAGAVTSAVVPTFSNDAVGFPSLAVDVVQGGAFSEIEKGEQIVKRLNEMGFAATLTNDTDPIYMFIGLGGDRSQSTAISQLYEGLNDTYLKTYRVEANVQGEVDPDISSWFFAASSSFKHILQLTVDGLTRDGAIITSEQVTKTKEQLSDLQGKRDGAFEKLPSSVQPYALAIGDALVKAGQNIEKYVQTEDKKQLWMAQQELLKTLISYEQFINEWQ